MQQPLCDDYDEAYHSLRSNLPRPLRMTDQHEWKARYYLRIDTNLVEQLAAGLLQPNCSVCLSFKSSVTATGNKQVIGRMRTTI